MSVSETVARVRALREIVGQEEPKVTLGRFVVERELGRGGNGVVYEAVDPLSERPVALKVLSDVRADQLARFKREFRALELLAHPNVVDIYELGRADDEWFFAMELVRGTDLVRYVRAEADPARRVARLRRAFAGLVEGIAAIHGAGMLHRDLKPSNVVVDGAGRPVVLDLGMVGDQEEELPADGIVAGTPAYMSPEQGAGLAATEASDLYAVGVMLYELLAGGLPFEGSGLAPLRAKARQAAPPITAPSLDDPELAALCMALLERRPDQRPTSAEVLAALGNAPSGREGTSSRRPRPRLVGREAELTELARAEKRAREGRTAVIAVLGAEGMGKTALLEEAASVLPPDVLRLSGRCSELECVPHNAVDSLIDALAAHLEKLPARELEALRPRHLSCLLALFPRLGSVSMGVPLDPTPPDAREIRRRAAEALKELLRRASLRSPVAILLDDLHLADADSVRLLSEVLTPPDAPALLLVCSAPPGHPSVVDLRKALTALGDAGPEYRQLVLGPLSQDALVELAHTALGALDLPSRSLAQAIASEATGSPFVAVALARHAARPEAGRPETIDLASVLSGHLAALGTTAAQALELLAVAGRPTREHLLHTALGAGSGGWLQELRRHGLVRRAARGSVWLTHGRIGDAVRARMTAVTARLRHRQLAQAGEVQSLDDPAWLAEHWAASGDDARGAGRALEAADLAGRRFAFRRAAELYHFAETHMGPDDPRRGETARRRGEALVFAGHGSEAADAYLEAIRRLPPTEARPVARAAVCQLLRSGRSAEGTALARDLLRDAGVPYPETRTHTLLHLQYERARLRIRGLELRAGRRPSLSPGDEHRLDLMGALFRELTAFDPERAALLLSRFLRDALGAGDPNRVRHGLAWAAFNTAWLGGAAVTAKADELLRRADSLPGGQDSGYAKGTSLLAWAGRFLFSGWHRRARDLAAEAESQFRSGSVGSTWEESIAVTVRLAAAEFAGPLSDIVTESEVRAVQATEREDRLSQGMLALARTFAHLMMDDVDGARDVLHAQQAVLGPTFGSLHFWSMTRTADALLYQGLGRAALDHYQGTSAHYQSSILARAETMRMATANRRARAALMAFHETGDGAYLKSARRDADHLRRMDRPDARMWTHVLDACFAEQAGAIDQARSLLGAALADAHAAELHVHGAYVRLHAAWLDRDPAAEAGSLESLSAMGIRDAERWGRMMIPRPR